ncbi:MAG: tRNA-dihydrouridine synthase family protein [Oligoflexales bacterium]
MLHLGQSLDDGVGLAPMEGVSDFPMRLWMSVTSQPLFQVTPFLRVTHTYPKHLPINWAPEIFMDGLSDCLSYSLVPQLMCPQPEPFVEVARKILQHSPFVELNCGCPAPMVVGKGAGSGLLREPAEFHKFIKYCSNELGKGKLAIKIRTGFESSARYTELIDGLRGLSLKRLTIHGRTRAQKYQGYADWEQILLAAMELNYPVHGSGDIVDDSCLRKKLGKQHPIKGAIVGRGALRNPWIFKELRTSARTQIEGKTLLTAIESYALILEVFSSKPESLYSICLDGTFKQCIDNDYEAWKNLSSKLKAVLPSSQEPMISKKSLGKVKMLWNYLRSSLPPSLFNPKLLRCSKFEEFLGAISEQLSAATQERRFLELKWQKEYDWIYAGEKKPVI